MGRDGLKVKEGLRSGRIHVFGVNFTKSGNIYRNFIKSVVCGGGGGGTLLRSRLSDEAGLINSGGRTGGDEYGGGSSSPLVVQVGTAAIDMEKEVSKDSSTVTVTTTATMTTASAPDGDAIKTERDHQNPPPLLSPGTVKKERL